jgi:hypothetical protein
MSAICHAIQTDDNKTGLSLGKKARKGTSESPHPKAYLIVVKNFEDDNGLITVKCDDSATLLIDGEEKKIRLTVERILIEEDSAFKVKGEVYRAKKVYQK